MASKSMLASLLQKQLATKLLHQPYYTFSDGFWAPNISPTPALAAFKGEGLKSFRVITWNIDFMTLEPRARMSSALEYLETLVDTVPKSSAIVIFLQEMTDSNTEHEHLANDLRQLKNAPWIQERFYLTDIDKSRWKNSYGQTTLIDRRLLVSSVSRLPFISEFSRDALLVDICLVSEEPKFLRLSNVHLDSMTGSMRPIQWKALASFLQRPEEGIEASIVAGDCNTTQPRDRTEPQENGFKDSYLELGGIEDDLTGATWGFQSLDAKRWGPSRLDKQVYCGKVHVNSLERIGVGVEVQDELARMKLVERGAVTFVTDHYGLMGDYTILI
jgi:tyrosyl-DNA phosphodiesterase 2